MLSMVIGSIMSLWTFKEATEAAKNESTITDVWESSNAIFKLVNDLVKVIRDLMCFVVEMVSLLPPGV